MSDGQFDFVVIGAGPAGEAAAFKARAMGASVAVVDRRWFGGVVPAHRRASRPRRCCTPRPRHASGAATTPGSGRPRGATT